MTYEEFLEHGQAVNDRGELRFRLCPSCGDGKGHFYYNETRGVGHCKKCGYAPNKRVLIRDMRLTAFTSAPLLEEIVGELDRLDAQTSVLEDGSGEDARPFIPLPPEASPVQWSTTALTYLQRRGITLEDSLRYELHYCSRGPFARRIVFPVRDVEGELVGYTSRTIDPEGKPKYRTPSLFSTSAYLYGEDLLAAGGDIILVEGPTDRIRVGEDCVATFGKSMSELQIQTLMSFEPRSVSLMWDPDAQKEMLEVATLLSRYVPVRVVVLPAGTDPGSTSKRALAHAVRATPVFRSMDWNLLRMEDLL